MRTFVHSELSPPPSSYQLLDCGDGEKLEQLGAYTLIRPSSLAIWRRKLPKASWDRAHARFSPDDGWIAQERLPENWPVAFADICVQASLLRNGQIGIFPEHAAYLQLLEQSSERQSQDTGYSVLNLFGYTGLFTVFALKHGAEVTHIDVNQPALDSLKANIQENRLPDSGLRIIKDDALGFLQRAVKKQLSFDCVALDPPNFSRFGKGKTWELEDIIYEMLELCVALILPKRGTLFFSSHHPALVKELIASILLDMLPEHYSCQVSTLGLVDSAGRMLPHGGLTFCQDIGK